MKVKIISALMLVASGYASAAAMENAIHVAEAKASRGGARLASVDFESDGQTSAFQMRITLPADAKKIDLSACLSELPKSFTGVCKAYGNKVAITVYSANNSALEAGLASVGKISFVSRETTSLAVDKVSATHRDGNSAVTRTEKVAEI